MNFQSDTSFKIFILKCVMKYMGVPITFVL